MKTPTVDLFQTQLDYTRTLDIEESVISYLLQNSDEIPSISKYFKPHHFVHESCQVLYQTAIDLTTNSLSVDTTGLIIQLEKSGKLDRVGVSGANDVHRLFLGALTSPSIQSIYQSIDFLIELGKRKDFSRQMGELLSYKIGKLDTPFDRIVELATQAFTDLITDGKQKDNELTAIGSSIDSTAQFIIEKTINKRNGIQSGTPTGFSDIDKHCGGWQPNDLVIIGARPGMGKSSFALSTCMEIAKNAPVAFFSLEMDKRSMETRCLSMASGVNSEAIRDGELTDLQIEKILMASESLKDLNYWGTDKFSPSIDFVVSECRKLAAKQGQLGGICIDYIQLMVNKQENSLNEVSDITRKLKLLAVELKCPVFGLSQLNRGVETRNDKRPIKSDLRDSGSLEQDADIIIMLYRDEVYNPDTVDKNIAEILFRKFRNGREGTVKLMFDGATTQFKNLATRY